jgi:glycosyltransferase involved in cell wall biosynthesis
VRVCILTTTNRGGAWIAPLASALLQRDHEVRAYVADEPGRLHETLARRGVDVRCHPAAQPARFLHPPRLRDLRALRRDLADYDPDVLNYHLYAAALLGRYVGATKRALRVHSVPGPLFLDSGLTHTVERLASSRDDLIVCTSGATYRHYERLHVPTERLVVLPYGLDLEHFQPAGEKERRDARAALGLANDDFVAVCVAYFYGPKWVTFRGRSVKGHDILFRAWKRFRHEGGRGRLLVVGGGFGEAGVRSRRRMIERSGLEEDPSVAFVETVTDVRTFYRAADVSISTSRSENLGAPAEASAMGVPSIASDIGGFPELVIHGDTGWTYPGTDVAALVRLVHRAADSKRDTLAVMGRSARALAETKLDVGRLSSEFVDLLERRVRARNDTPS